MDLTDWKSQLPLIPLNFDEEKISEEELLKVEQTQKSNEIGSGDEDIDQGYGTDTQTHGRISSIQEESEEAETNETQNTESQEKEKEEPLEEPPQASEEVENIKEEIKEVEVKEEVNESNDRTEEKIQLMNLDAIQLSYLRHLGTILEGLEFERQVIDQRREELVSIVPKPKDVLRLAHLIPPIFSISRSFVDEDDPDSFKIPKLLYSKSLKKIKEKTQQLGFEFGNLRSVCFQFKFKFSPKSFFFSSKIVP